MTTTTALSPSELEACLSAAFPKAATCWSQAGDEVRDMCRAAREAAEIPAEQAINFKALTTPALWNTHGIEATVRFYTAMPDVKREAFCANFAHWLGIGDAEERTAH
jgi:hypothetical protein